MPSRIWQIECGRKYGRRGDMRPFSYIYNWRMLLKLLEDNTKDTCIYKKGKCFKFWIIEGSVYAFSYPVRRNFGIIQFSVVSIYKWYFASFVWVINYHYYKIMLSAVSYELKYTCMLNRQNGQINVNLIFHSGFFLR